MHDYRFRSSLNLELKAFGLCLRQVPWAERFADGVRLRVYFDEHDRALVELDIERTLTLADLQGLAKLWGSQDVEVTHEDPDVSCTKIRVKVHRNVLDAHAMTNAESVELDRRRQQSVDDQELARLRHDAAKRGFVLTRKPSA